MSEDKLPVVFIHGLYGGCFEYLPIIRFLRKAGYSSFHKFSYENWLGAKSLEVIAGEFERFVGGIPKFNIIGLSLGGIIARMYASKHANRVNRCITICSPHHGSYTAYLLPFREIQKIRPGSEFLRRLNKVHTKFFSVYNPLDLIVLPGVSAKSGLEAKRVYSLLHPFAFWSGSTLDFIRKCLEE